MVSHVRGYVMYMSCGVMVEPTSKADITFCLLCERCVGLCV